MKLLKSFVIVALLFVAIFAAPHQTAAQAGAPNQVLNPTLIPSPPSCPTGTPGQQNSKCIMVDQRELGFRIPNLTEILTFAIRAVFVFGGLAALFYLLLGAFAWITSGGDKEKVSAAQQKIQAAVIGVIMIAVVLAIVVTLEQVVLGGRICLGLSCPITIPTLLKDPNAPASTGTVNLLDPTATPIPSQTPVPGAGTANAASTTPTNQPTNTSNQIPNETNRVYAAPDTGSGQ